MKKLLILSAIVFSTILMNGQVLAIPSITLDPTPPSSVLEVQPPGNLFVDINISGLGTDLLGAFDLDFLYDATIFTPLLIPPAGFGNALGDIFLGEAVGGIDTSTPGVINLFEVSLLTSAELFTLQNPTGGSFTLATLGLFAPGAVPAGTSTIATSNIILSDDLGNNLNPVANPISTVYFPKPIPEPSTMLLLGTGLVGLAGFGRRKLLKN